MHELYVTRDRNMAGARIGDAWLCATGRAPISDEAWREFHELCLACATRFGRYRAVLQYSPRQAPSAAQRKVAQEEYAAKLGFDAVTRVALLSDSSLVRGAITAMGWLARTKTDTRAFKPMQREIALTWIQGGAPFDSREGVEALRAAVTAVGWPWD